MAINPKDMLQGVAKNNVLDAWRASLEKTSRIILGRGVNVKVVTNSRYGYAGWTDGEDVFLDGDIVRAKLTQIAQEESRNMAVVGLKGLVYHEDGHILVSPRFNSEIVKLVEAKRQDTGETNWWIALNVLEDQRMESLFVATYPPAARYFKALSLQYVVRNGNQNSYVLAAGRSFLPLTVRAGLRKIFRDTCGNDLTEEVESILFAYKKVLYPADTQKAFSLVRRMKAVLDAIGFSGGGQDHGRGPVGNHRGGDGFKKGNAGVNAQKQAIKNLPDTDKDKEALEDAESKLEKKPAPIEAQQAGSTGSEGEEMDSNDLADNAEAADGGEADSNLTGKNNTPVDPDNESGGSGQNDAPAPLVQREADPFNIDDVINAADQELEDLLEAPEVQNDVADALDAMKAILNRMGGGAEASGEALKGTLSPVAGDMNVSVRKVVERFRRVRLELEPEWERQVPNGKLNVGAVARRQVNPAELNVFDRWHEGAEAEGGIESVILIDLSASMKHSLGVASAALWIIKKAFDDAGIAVTILGYSSWHSVLFRRGEKAARNQFPVFPSQSSTNPGSALKEALKILASSSASNKLLITITDGQWDRGGSNDELVKAIKRTGAVTSLLGLDNAVTRYGKHAHEFGRDIRTPSEVVDVAADIVNGLIVKAAAFA